MNKPPDFKEFVTTELELRYSLEMTQAVIRSDAKVTDRDVAEFAAILGINRRYPVTQRWPHTWTCQHGEWK